MNYRMRRNMKGFKMPNNKDNACWDDIMNVFKLIGEGENFNGRAFDGRISMSGMKEIFGNDWTYYRIRKIMRDMKGQGLLNSMSHRYGKVS